MRRRSGISRAAVGALIVVVLLILVGAYLAMRPSPAPTTAPPATTTGAPPTSPPAPKYADTIIIGVTDKVSDLDPAMAYDFYTWEVFNNIGEGPFKYKPGTTELIPGIIESYEVQEGGKVYILHLRQNLKFADGTPCTAQTLKWSIDRVARIQGDPAWFVLDFVNYTEVVDDYTLKIVLQQPVAFFPAVLAVPTYFPIPPDKYPADQVSSDNTAGSVGPYKIVKWVRDQELVLEANPYYYGEPPKTKRIIVRFYKDATSLRMALEAGEIDIAWRTLNPTDIKDLRSKPGIKIYENPGSFIRYIVINTNIPPFDNKLVRQALAAALNRQAICDTVFMGTTEPLYSLVPNGMWSHVDAFKEKYGDHNIELARQLLQQAGYSEENKLVVDLWYTTTHYGDTEADVAALIKAAWEETGMIQVNVHSAEWSTYLDLTRQGQLPVTLYGWYPDYIDPDNFLYPFLHTGSNRWLGEPYSNPDLDALLEQAQVELDQNVRAQLYQQIQQILAEDAPIIPIFQGKLVLAAKDNVQGIVLDPVMLLRYYLLVKLAEG
ncbi:MAG: ABC transporter substrate-binding protein [Candidatus Korarchaeota archaeon]|nr:ABC transporter substrate-binding protein [Candidatus Korarchaeota archaeon]